MSYVSDLRAKIGHMPICLSASLGIIYDEKNKKMLFERRTDNGMWCIPGGGLDLGEDFIDGLKREIKEETNLEINNPELFTVKAGIHMVYPNGDEVYYTDAVYIVKEFSGELEFDSESDKLCWVDINNLPDNIMPTQYDYIINFVNKIKEDNDSKKYIKN